MADHKKSYSQSMLRTKYLVGHDGLYYKYSGINEGLINDKKRNVFYSDILKECEGKNCIDVGSGSGLLAFMAIQHGANHVTCIEQNIDSCHHIEKVAKKMGIDHKIRVINDEFQSSRYEEYGIQNAEIIFHELIGSHIWNDTIGSAFNRYLPGIKILPERYQLNFKIRYLSQNECNDLIDYHRGYVKEDAQLDPGIDLSSDYIEYYQNVINQRKYEFYNPVRVRTIDTIPMFNRYHLDCNLYRRIVIDINDSNTYKMGGFSFTLPESNQPYLLFIHPYLHSGNHTLDFRDTHFSGLQQPILIPPVNEDYRYSTFYYHIFDGDMKIDDFYV